MSRHELGITTNEVNPQLNGLRQLGVARLTTYAQTPAEKRLREHHENVLDAFLDALRSGETAGYVNHPTGSGKTILALRIAEVLGMRTLILSPTLTILQQTGKAATQHTDLDVRNYSSVGKEDVSEGVVNTTYLSAPNLIRRGELKPNEVELLICDELHTALGEVGHTLFRQFPNAIMLGLTATPYAEQLNGYIRRGIVNPNERWIGLFTNQIHEMGLEEGMEREILAPLDAYLFRTNTVVKDIDFEGTGLKRDYNRSQLEHQVSTEARNWLAVGMIAGPGKIPRHVEIPRPQLDEIERIHEMIKGKRTAVFGFSIDSIEHLGTELKRRRIRAEEVHYRVSKNLVADILDLHSTGDIQVVLGIDSLRLGWDSPATQVGIYMVPTRSGIVALQELGRILRPSPETGKERATAVQMIDQFAKKGQAPIIIPNLFDPYYVLRGTQTGAAPSKHPRREAEPKTIVTFSGLQVNTIIEEASSNELLQRRLKNADLVGMGTIIDSTIKGIMSKDPGIKLLDLYRQIADSLPYFIPQDRQELVLQGLASIDSNTVELAKKLFILLNLSAVLAGVDQFFSENEDENEELLQTGIVKVIELADRIKLTAHIKGQINMAAKQGAAEFIAQREHMHPKAVIDKVHEKIKEAVDQLMEGAREPIQDKSIDLHAQQVAERLGVPALYVRVYLDYKNASLAKEPVLTEKGLAEIIFIQELPKAIEALFEKAVLSSREQDVLRLRYIYDVEIKNIASDFELSQQGIIQIIARALRKLRSPRSIQRFLYRFVDVQDSADFIQDHLLPVPIISLDVFSAEAKALFIKNGYLKTGDLQGISNKELLKITEGKDGLHREIHAAISRIRRKGATYFTPLHTFSLRPYGNNPVASVQNLSQESRYALMKNGFRTLGDLDYLSDKVLRAITDRDDIKMQIKTTIRLIESGELDLS